MLNFLKKKQIDKQNYNISKTSEKTVFNKIKKFNFFDEYEVFKNKKVAVVDIQGNVKMYKQFKRSCGSEYCLLSDSDGDNKIFHHYFDCYEDWTPE